MYTEGHIAEKIWHFRSGRFFQEAYGNGKEEYRSKKSLKTPFPKTPSKVVY